MQRAGVRWDVERRREVGIRTAAVVCNYAFLRSRQPRRLCSLDIVRWVILGATLL